MLEILAKLGDMQGVTKMIEEFPKSLEKWDQFQQSIILLCREINSRSERIEMNTQMILRAVEPDMLDLSLVESVVANAKNDPRNRSVEHGGRA